MNQTTAAALRDEVQACITEYFRQQGMVVTARRDAPINTLVTTASGSEYFRAGKTIWLGPDRDMYPQGRIPTVGQELVVLEGDFASAQGRERLVLVDYFNGRPSVALVTSYVTQVTFNV